MNAFNDACLVEKRAMTNLMPIIGDVAFNGRIVTTNKGRLSAMLQKTVGDVLINTTNERLWSIEIKAEEENKHGNLFLETWSNRSRFTLGWMFTLNADILWYYFVNEQLLLSINFQKLKEWAFIKKRIYAFDEKPQGKYSQLNDTWGRCVPITIIKKEVGYSCHSNGCWERHAE